MCNKPSGDWKRLAKEHIRTAHGHRQQCGEGNGGGVGGQGLAEGQQRRGIGGHL